MSKLIKEIISKRGKLKFCPFCNKKTNQKEVTATFEKEQDKKIIVSIVKTNLCSKCKHDWAFAL